MLGLGATARTASEGTPGEGGWSGEEHGGETEAATRPWEACSSAQVRAQDQNKTKKTPPWRGRCTVAAGKRQLGRS